ncbi:hypothetical protein O181_052061 [Austropuccinia psidii MF-1]|uniref:Uncharacterized protein n=1 Tax=Austropuccinia psidii MF-1 TaxID=1389203 RepID=A0A9Q3E4W4_9BASI|nr:hypothetical protein [Austropuccinia psidii MF-1]
MAMARGNLSFGRLSPCLDTHGSQTPNLPPKQTPQQPTPGPSGPQWSEDLFCESSQTNEPPIPGLSPSSKPHENVLTGEPEPEVALTQSMEEPFDPSLVPSSPHSHNEAFQGFTDLQPTLMIPQAILHKSIKKIFSEHCRLLHMISFVDATHQNEMHQEFREELNSLLAQELEAYPKEDIPRIVSKYLEK